MNDHDPPILMLMLDRLGSGGAAQVVLNIALGVDRRKYRPLVCVTRQLPTLGQAKMLEDAGIEWFELPRNSRWNLAAWRGCCERLGTVTILHAHGSSSSAWARVLGRLYRVPIILTHEHRASDNKTRVMRTMDRLMGGLSDQIIHVSRHDAEKVVRLEGHPPERVTYLYNGIDVARFAPRLSREEARDQFSLSHRRRLIGVVGRLHAVKNHRGFLDAWRLLPEEIRRSSQAVFVGDGPHRTLVESMIAERGLDKEVILLGAQEDAPAAYRALDLVVLPSISECLPMVLLEALAARCPMVATRVGGVPEILEPLGWEMPPPGDVHALAQAMQATLALDPAVVEQRLALGERLVRETFSRQAFVAQVEAIYDRLLQKKLGLPACRLRPTAVS